MLSDLSLNVEINWHKIKSVKVKMFNLNILDFLYYFEHFK